MNLAQEMAAVIRHIVDASGVEKTYYGTQPEGFVYPSVYFPVPDVEQRPDTLQQFQLYYTFYVQFFSRTAEDAARRAQAALRAIARAHNCIELYDDTGKPCGDYMNIADMYARKVSDEPGVAQLTVSFIHRELYDRPKVGPVRAVVLDMAVGDAFDEATHLVSRFYQENADRKERT